ncbi:MAG: GSCFA domain-containing protein [Verrucomicrobia bacterium]|nr:GSCFA domain-containing protein [Verrucomicrobiota bacterium]|tara:strand:- start:1098 stop:2075 length:978 start_codon:yes stop_codon:yes gene_type:complete
MKLQTHIIPFESPLHINHHDSMCFFGSCFADNIGKKLIEHKFDCLINPLGIGYNPISILNLIQLNTEDIDWQNIIKSNQVYFMYEFHSKFNCTDLSEYKTNIQKATIAKNQQLAKSTVLFISLGTAFVHKLKSSNRIATNCHKQSSELFEKKLLTVNEIKKSLLDFATKLSLRYQKEFQFVFTVSPVRHLKEGFRQNQLSKSILHLAIKECMEKNKNIHYFPAYEIMMDDLRDYRFYKRDLIHPNGLAVDYIWDHFNQVYFNEKTRALNKEIAQINKSLQHKAFQENTLTHQNFIMGLISKLKVISQKHTLNFNNEIRRLEAHLN